jgi:type IV pilus assembly protein PilV
MLMIKQVLKNRHRGSSLIEVLVTMVVIALGLLGQAALTAQSSKSNNAAFMRSQATLLAYDMLERIRLNRTLAKNGLFTNGFATPGGDPSDNVPSGTAIQNVELRDWKTNIEQSLPSGDGSVKVDGNGFAIIIISWCEVAKNVVCSNDANDANRTKFTTMSDL